MEIKLWSPRRIKNFRGKYRISRKTLSLYLGNSPSTIDYWEKGVRTPTVMAMILLSRVEMDFKRCRGF
jgi:DNA-binding transcriptional regulator YiaG